MKANLKKYSEEIYATLGGGHTERTYQNALNLELLEHKYGTILEYPINIKYKNRCMSTGYVDIVIHDSNTPIELKAISKLTEKDFLQLEKYINNMNTSEGYIINFGFRELEMWHFVNGVRLRIRG